MATAFTPSLAPSSRQPALHAPITVVTAPVAPSGTFAPGTKVQVGGHRVVIEKYLSEGGFAHVYLVRLPKAINGDDGAVLKRVAVPDKEALASMRTEVETMKKLKGRRHIVTYMDSHASQLRGGGYEVFLLMEYCNGGGLMDFMNTRLQNRLTEPEILSIFSDVAQGVANMHYLKPPLLHRDLKVENVLITSSGTSRRYKLCDFGSAAAPTPAATNAAEGRLIEEDVQKHTTLQYRSPEMIDVYRKQPIDEKSDIWALGVLLYKLCYYKTPFEDQGQMAILNARFKFPGYPSFSDDLKKLIASMLREVPQLRPNIYQVVREVCLMRRTDVPIKDIYFSQTPSQARQDQQPLLPQPHIASPPMIGAYQVSPMEEKQTLPDIVPMRRGRPIKSELESKGPKPPPSPIRGAVGDPFTALDSTLPSVPNGDLVDGVSCRFPPLDEFSILHDSGSKFAFDLSSEPTAKAPKDIRARVTDALADDAFAQPLAPAKALPNPGVPTLHLDAKLTDVSELSISKASQLPTNQQDLSQRPQMVSTGTMTSPSPPSTIISTRSPRPIFHFPPAEHRSSSQPRRHDADTLAASNLKPDALVNIRPGLRDHRSKSQLSALDVAKSSTSSRPSLEGPRPSMLETHSTINRSKSASSRARPFNVNEDGTRTSQSRETARGERYRTEPHQETYNREYIPSSRNSGPSNGLESSNISSDVEFLRAIEEQDPTKRKVKRSGSGSKHAKRSSMPSLSLSGTKSLLVGRFGDAFRRFETNSGGPSQRGSSPSPKRGDSDLTPIAGSEATDGRSDDGHAIEETEPIPPEVRRELERRRLSQEEKRVADAGAAYRRKFTEKPEGQNPSSEGQRNSRAASIQSKVKSLLDESGRASPLKPDQDYGLYSSNPPVPNPQVQDEPFSRTIPSQSQIQKKPPPSNNALHPSMRSNPPPSEPAQNTYKQQTPVITSSVPSTTDRPFPRPSAPPKPHALRAGNVREDLPPPSKPTTSSLVAGKTQLPYSVSDSTAIPPVGSEDWEKNFSKRYPALAGLEMVETEIDSGGGGRKES